MIPKCSNLALEVRGGDFPALHRTRACVGGCFERERDAWTDVGRVKSSSDPAEARSTAL